MTHLTMSEHCTMKLHFTPLRCVAEDSMDSMVEPQVDTTTKIYINNNLVVWVLFSHKYIFTGNIKKVFFSFFSEVSFPVGILPSNASVLADGE